MKRVGILLTSPLTGLEQSYVKPFVDAMTRLGWVQGREIEYVEAYPVAHITDPAAMQIHAETLVAKSPDVIWLISTASAKAALAATQRRPIPIVGSAVSTAIDSKAHAAAHFTGIMNTGYELGGDRFNYLREVMPNLQRVGVLLDPGNAGCREELGLIQQVAASSKVQVIPVNMSRANDVDTSCAELRDNEAEAVLITHLPLFQNNRQRILQHAEQQRIPAVGHRTFFVEDGALMSYSSCLPDQMRQSADLVDSILRGANTSTMSLKKPQTFELAINRETAANLSITIPPALLSRAYRVVG